MAGGIDRVGHREIRHALQQVADRENSAEEFAQLNHLQRGVAPRPVLQSVLKNGLAVSAGTLVDNPESPFRPDGYRIPQGKLQKIVEDGINKVISNHGNVLEGHLQRFGDDPDVLANYKRLPLTNIHDALQAHEAFATNSAAPGRR